MKAAVKAVVATNKVKKSDTVKVYVRVRPLGAKEVSDGRKESIFADISKGTITLKPPPNAPADVTKLFTFDGVFDKSVTQKAIYDQAARATVECVLDGYNGTVFAYGQTGSGKTHTMEGSVAPELQGIIPNSFKQVMDYVASTNKTGTLKQYLVCASFLELYNEEIRDLLGANPKAKLDLRERQGTGVYAQGLSQTVVRTVQELNVLLEVGRVAVCGMKSNCRRYAFHSSICLTVASCCCATWLQSMWVS